MSIKENVKDILILSEEQKISLYPMDFEEFMWAMDNHQLMDVIKDAFDKKISLLDGLHRKV